MALPSISAVSVSMNQLAAQLRAETVAPTAITAAPHVVPFSQPTDFSGLIQQGLAIVSHAQQVANVDQRAFAAGSSNAPSLAQTMLSTEKASVAFQEMIGIRNELARGYETLITMPV
ncbi:flagellar hook-basal body complex protein FliE [Acidithiobacillus thiooxidans]|uniref:Flagellar hook-basal body complex protein FliE n=1 Tax=Acidithiobacillus thiooxidans TaxID=930 RepID=A0A1C2IT49_ACITH|nr:flagellar hook-basal body complex protein FliE [Acidithiobacillus thiooxidans]OCX72175.1 hypothetical protein A6M23_10290 [Acidithiobacillus thiooxidans]OCX79226.1 hypothetical protein A6P08_18235 [Acidithiobacillus thiooxidans]